MEETENIIKFPKIEENCVLKTKEVVPEQHFTQPPARYTDASLIKDHGGTWHRTPQYLRSHTCHHPDEELCVKGKKAIFPTELGEIVNDIMKEYFPEIVNIGFTAEMETSWTGWRKALTNGKR